MEFDIGTLIYIIVTIVAIVAGVTGNKKKPSPGNPGSGEKTGSKSFLEKLEEQIGAFSDEARGTQLETDDEEVFVTDQGMEEDGDELTEEFAEAPAAEASRSAEEKAAPAYEFAWNDPSNVYSQYEGYYDLDEREKSDYEDLKSSEARRTTDEDEIKVIDMDEVSHVDYFEIIKDFDLGTAVIYSTIINRKEY